MLRHPFRLFCTQTMTEVLLRWALCAGLRTIAAGATRLAAGRVAQAVERQDRTWQEAHRACPTSPVTTPGNCPPGVLKWLSQSLVPADRLDTLPLLGFQRCETACGRDPARDQAELLNRPRASPA